MAFDIKFLQNLSHLFADHFHLGLESCSSCFLDFFCRSRALKCFRGQTSAQGCWKGRTQRCKGRLEKTVFKRSCKNSDRSTMSSPAPWTFLARPNIWTPTVRTNERRYFCSKYQRCYPLRKLNRHQGLPGHHIEQRFGNRWTTVGKFEWSSPRGDGSTFLQFCRRVGDQVPGKGMIPLWSAIYTFAQSLPSLVGKHAVVWQIKGKPWQQAVALLCCWGVFSCRGLGPLVWGVTTNQYRVITSIQRWNISIVSSRMTIPSSKGSLNGFALQPQDPNPTGHLKEILDHLLDHQNTKWRTISRKNPFNLRPISISF